VLQAQFVVIVGWKYNKMINLYFWTLYPLPSSQDVSNTNQARKMIEVETGGAYPINFRKS
jgi:hypothetical protein